MASKDASWFKDRAGLVIDNERAQVVKTLSDMTELSRRSAEVSALDRQEAGITQSLTKPFSPSTLEGYVSLRPQARPQVEPTLEAGTSLRPQARPQVGLVPLEKLEMATTPETVTGAVAEATPPVAADNPLEYIFNKGFIGLDEKNPEHQGTIAGFINNAVPNFVTDDSQVTKGSKAWCGAFVDHVLENLGVARLDTGDKYDNLRAAQYLGYGEDAGGVDNAQAGDLIVVRNTDGWHVSFYVGKNEKGDVLALGGNQGNSVKVSAYSAAKVKGVRRITDVGSMDVDMLKDISSDIAENSGEEGTR
jgi:uncharacterized protein (TIGR02594 family)